MCVGTHSRAGSPSERGPSLNGPLPLSKRVPRLRALSKLLRERNGVGLLHPEVGTAYVSAYVHQNRVF